jgi:nitrogen regulatory protein PII
VKPKVTVGRRVTPRIYRGAKYTVNFAPKVKIEVAVSDQADKKAISGAAKRGQIGDGKIFTFGIEQTERIRLAKSATTPSDTAIKHSRQANS